MLRDTENHESVQGGQPHCAAGFDSAAILHGPSSARNGQKADSEKQRHCAVLGGQIESDGADTILPSGRYACSPSLSPDEAREGHVEVSEMDSSAVPSPVSQNHESVQGDQQHSSGGYSHPAALHGPSSARNGREQGDKVQVESAIPGGPVEGDGISLTLPNGHDVYVPSLSPNETGEGHYLTTADVSTGAPSPVSPEIIHVIQELQVRRKHHIRTATKISNSVGSMVRRAMGWQAGHTDAEAIKAKASKLVAAYMAGKPTKHPVTDALAMDLETAREQLKISWNAERNVTLSMEKHARNLPGYAFAKSVAGFGDLGFAVLIGEAGDLSKYETVGKSRGYEKLWKRLGLAPYEGLTFANWKNPNNRTRARTDTEWIEAGYSPRRRAEIWAVIEDPLFRHQSMRKGPYHAIYLARRERTAVTHPDWTKGHSHHDAKRVMVKALIKDLWVEWGRACSRMPDLVDEPLPSPTHALEIV
jgi:hypothetical protein